MTKSFDEFSTRVIPYPDFQMKICLFECYAVRKLLNLKNNYY